MNRHKVPHCMHLFTVLLVCVSSTAAAKEHLTATKIVESVGLDQHLDQQVSLDLEFRDEHGRMVKLQQFFGSKPVILSLVYYRCPMLCTEVLNGVLRSTQAMKFNMGEDYQVISVSIDPRETPQMAAAKKEQYVKRYRRPGAEQGWHFLTGNQVAIEQLARKVGFRYRYDASSDQFAHASGIILLTPEGRISRYLYGIDFNPNDLRLGLVESSQGRIGSPVDQILLLCFHYDPQTGKYGLVISRVLQLAGIATVIGLGSFLWVMYRHECRRSAAERISSP